MAKITVHGGASIAGAQVVSGAWSDTSTADEWPAPPDEAAAEPAALHEDDSVEATSVAGEQTPGDEMSDSSVNEDAEEIAERPQPNYGSWLKAALQAELTRRGIEYPARATNDELAQLLDDSDAGPSDG